MSRDYKTNRRNGSSNKNGKPNFRKDKGVNNNKKSDSVQADKPTNNPSWYMTNSAIVEGVANMPFNMPVGSMFNLTDFTSSNFAEHHTPTVSAPGVAVFDVVPTFGTQINPASSLNIASQAIYTWVRYYNSGSRVYTPADLMIYLAANGQIYSMINWAMRIYGTISHYDHRNKYLGKALIEAMNVDYNDFLGRMAEFRGRLNLLIDKAASFVVPNTMTYFLRTASMFTDIYTDGSSIKDQLYMYNPVGFYRYTFDTSDSPEHDGAYLKFHVLTADDHKMTVDDVIQFIDDSVSALINSHDQGVISGDLYKAYQGNILTLVQMAENYRTNIVNDPWVLNQMKNATISSYWEYPDLYQNPAEGVVVFNPTITTTYSSTDEVAMRRGQLPFMGMKGSRVLTLPTESSDTSQVMEFTRMQTILTDTEQVLGDNGTFIASGTLITGTEIILRARFYFYTATNAGDSYGALSRAFFNYYWRDYSDSSALYDRILIDTLRTYFKYFPAVIKFAVDSDANMHVLGLDLDIDNYTLIDTEELKHIHDVALMNMFATDAVAKLK